MSNLCRLLVFAGMFGASACDSAPAAAAADPAAEKYAKENADNEARVAKRKADREAKDAEAKKQGEDIKVKIQEVTVIPEGTKMPKKAAEACEFVVTAQSGFMKKFHPQIDEAGLSTQLGLLRKQCLEMGDVKVAMCQKFALEATDELLQKSINEYLPVCMGKYGKK